MSSLLQCVLFAYLLATAILCSAVAASALLAVDDAGDRLLTWASEADGFVVNVELADFPEGRGLAAKQDIMTGDVLAFVPSEYILDASAYEAGVHVIASSEAQLVLERNRGEETPHWHYIQALPSTPPMNLPMLQPQVGLLLRAYASQLPRTPRGSRLAEFISTGLSCATEVRKKTGAPVETARWACSMIMSRRFRLGNNRRDQLCPILDMMNHNADVEKAKMTKMTSYMGRSGDGMRASRPYAKHEQIFDFYGHASDLSMLAQYGFATGSQWGSVDVLGLERLSPEVPAPTYAPWLHSVPPEYTMLRACGSFLARDNESRRSNRILRLMLNSTSGFEPVALDCIRIGRYRFKNLHDFRSAMQLQEFVPMSDALQRISESWSGTMKPASTMNTNDERKQRGRTIDEAVFRDTYKRCMAYASIFDAPAFQDANQMLAQVAEDQSGSAMIIRALWEEQKAANQCMQTLQVFMHDAYDIDLHLESESRSGNGVWLLVSGVEVRASALVMILATLGCGCVINHSV